LCCVVEAEVVLVGFCSAFLFTEINLHQDDVGDVEEEKADGDQNGVGVKCSCSDCIEALAEDQGDEEGIAENAGRQLSIIDFYHYFVEEIEDSGEDDCGRQGPPGPAEDDDHAYVISGVGGGKEKATKDNQAILFFIQYRPFRECQNDISETTGDEPDDK